MGQMVGMPENEMKGTFSALWARRWQTTSLFNCQFDKVCPCTNASLASLLLVHKLMALPYSPYPRSESFTLWNLAMLSTATAVSALGYFISSIWLCWYAS